MQFGPDQLPVSTESIVIGPPLRGPAAVPVTTTTTVIAPPQFEPGPTLIDEPTNVIVTVPYVVSVSENGTEITNRVTNLNFQGANVVSSGIDLGNVTITITGPTITAGTGISVVTANSVTTISSTGTEVVYSGGNVTGTLTPDRNNGTIQKFTVTGNITLAPPTNVAAGQGLTLILTQDSVGGHVLNANVAYLFASGFQTLSTNSDAVDMLNIFSDGSIYYTTLTVDYS